MNNFTKETLLNIRQGAIDAELMISKDLVAIIDELLSRREQVVDMSDLLTSIAKSRPGGVYFNKWDKQIATVLSTAADCLRASQKAAEPERIKPILPVRDNTGCWRHPNRLDTPFDESGATTEAYSAWYAERGMEVDFVYMNQVFCDDCVCGDNVDYPALHWNPESPAGCGWVLTGIFDMEDGPCAEWIRYKDSDAEYGANL